MTARAGHQNTSHTEISILTIYANRNNRIQNVRACDSRVVRNQL